MGSATMPMRPPRPSGEGRLPDWPAARSKTSRGARKAASTSWPMRRSASARAENYLVGRPDLKDTIARLQAYQEAGADVLYAPGLKSKDDIVAVVRAVERP